MTAFRNISIGLLAVFLSACSTTTSDSTRPIGVGVFTDKKEDIASQPLKTPDLTELVETPARPLSSKFQTVGWSALPDWKNDDLALVWKGFINNCKGLMRPVSGSLSMPARATPRVWQPVCLAAQNSGISQDSNNTQQIRQFLESHLQPWRLLDSNGKVAKNTVTGYYEPLIRASKQKRGDYQWPLYAVPDDLLTIDLGGLYPELAGKRIRGKIVDGNRVVPYDTRSEITANAARQPKVLVWAEDPVEAFFLQIQGSGRAVLENGTAVRMAYGDHNGHPYSSIGKWLADKGELPLAKTSMQNIKQWAKDNPTRVHEMLNVNTAMVFFNEERIIDPILGPKGAYSIPLIAERSVAIDPTFVPLGTPVYLATQYPASQQPLRKLVFAQDTGAAIKGAARTDFYWGTGDKAGSQAGRMKQSGEMWVLWPKDAGTPSAR